MKNKPTSIKSPPSGEELSNRLEKVKNLMNKQDLDYYISFDPVNIYYLTNFANYVHERPFILVIPKKGIPKILAPLLEVSHVETRAKCELEIFSYFEYPAPKGENWFDKYRSLIEKDSKVGVESAMPLRIFDKTPGTKIKTDIIDEVRLIKTDYEIGRLVHACEIVNLGHKKLLELSRPGEFFMKIYNEARGQMMAQILFDIPHMNPIVTTAHALIFPPSRSHDPHNFTDLFFKLEEGGPHVSLTASQVDGYGVELERTLFLGTVPEKAIEPFNVVMEGRRLAYELAKPGANMGEIDAAVRKVFKEKGYGDKLLHRTGHGIGITGHEAPYLATGYDRKLEPNMLISIEPGIYIPGVGGFRHSDTVLITDDGNVRLTEAPDTLEGVTIQL
ncbi:MAG: M24 family metallopeptidase [Candidatus Lokiarchaeia archaeon]